MKGPSDMASRSAALAILLLAAFLAPTIALVPLALAGDVDDPDMEDKADDSASGRPARDMIAGWVGNETVDGIEFGIKMSALEPFTPYADWQNLPVVYYEVFFDLITPQGLSSYSVRATVPMHGPLAALTTYDLLSVTYGSQGAVLDETPLGNPTGRYIANSATILFTVAKTQIGDPARGDIVEGLWARTQSASQRNTGDAITEDTMLSHLSPGRSYILSGGETFYAIAITITSATSVNASPEDPARFDFLLHSDSEKSADVQIRNATALPANWTMSTDRQFYTVDAYGNTTGQIMITPGGNITNVTRRITVNGQYRTDQNATRSTENTQTLSILIPAAPGGGNNGGNGGAAKKGQDSTMALVGLGFAGAAAVGGAYWYFAIFAAARRRQRAKASFSKIAQQRLGKGPRSAPLPSGGPKPIAGAKPGVGPTRPGGPRGAGAPPAGPAMPRAPGGPARRPIPPRR